MKHHYEHVVIDVPLDEDCLRQINALKNSPVLYKAKRVTLLSVYNENMGGQLPTEFVNKNDYPNIESYILSQLEEIKENLIPPDTNPMNWGVKCLFNADFKRVSVEFLEETRADLVICATKGEQGIHGIFKDSFSFFLVQYSPCDVYVIRPVH